MILTVCGFRDIMKINYDNYILYINNGLRVALAQYIVLGRENMREDEKKELERLREAAKKRAVYINEYQREKYIRLVCLLPNEKKAAFDRARGGRAVSAYINSLIDADIARRGLSDDRGPGSDDFSGDYSGPGSDDIELPFA